MTRVDLGRLHELEAKATKGPWSCEEGNSHHPDWLAEAEDDAVFIAEARNTLPALLAEISAARKYIFWLEARDARLSEPYRDEEMAQEACRFCDEARAAYERATK